jgi:hypothetical protein
MNDQQRLREALHAAVPDVPIEPGRGVEARDRSARQRRRRRAVSGGVAVAILVGGAGVWTTMRHESRPTFSRTGAAACRALVHQAGAGAPVDSRVVDGPTAARWLGEIPTRVNPSEYRDDRRVTVCVTSRSTTWMTYIVGSGHVEQVTIGGYNQGAGDLASVMSKLDRLRTGGAPTTDAAFSCAGPVTERYPDVSLNLPPGATAVKICFDSPFYTPKEVLTQHVDHLVAAVNATRIGYSSPDFNCSVAEGDYGYSLVFRYADGTRRATAEPCRGLMLGQVARASDELDHTFTRLLERQVLSAQTFHPAPPCSSSPQSRPTGVGDVRHLVAFRYCAARTSGIGTSLGGPGMVLAKQWGAGFLGATTSPEGRCTRPRDGLPYLSLRDAWGNAFTMTVVACGRRQYPAIVAPDGRNVIYPLGDGGPSIDGLLRQLASS